MAKQGEAQGGRDIPLGGEWMRTFGQVFRGYYVGGLLCINPIQLNSIYFIQQLIIKISNKIQQ